MSHDSKYCWQCRLISGGGLMAASAYVVHHARKLRGYSNFVVTSIGYGIALVGGLRLFGFPPFQAKKETKQATHVEKKEDEYIVGKFPSRFN